MKFDDVFGSVMKVADKFGVRADNHEALFDQVLEGYGGEESELSAWLDQKIPRLFPVISARPVWIQEEEWPTTAQGDPLVFVGQFNVPVGKVGCFHDDAAFYLFVDAASGDVEVVVQEA